MDDREQKFFRADLNAVDAFMTLVQKLSDEDFRELFKAGQADVDPRIPGPLLEAMLSMEQEELRWLAELKDRLHLDDAEMYDRYNPKLYYF